MNFQKVIFTLTFFFKSHDFSEFQAQKTNFISQSLLNLELSQQYLNYSTITIVAGEKGKAELPCFVDNPLNDTIDLILWFRGESETALYSLDARKASIKMAKHFLNADLSSRVYVDMSEKPFSLIIEEIKSEDAGEYRCRVDFRKSHTQFRTIILDVLIGPKDVIIIDEYGQRLKDIAGPFNEGSHLALICETEGGTPEPTLIWFKGDKILDDSWIEMPQGVIKNELLISNLQRTDLMATLTCVASNSNLTKSTSSSIQLELNLKPLTVEITSIERPLSIGKKVDLICQSTGSRPPAIVTWWKGPNQLYEVSEEVSSNENLTQVVLHYKPASEDDKKILICRADHSILPSSAIEDSWILDIYYTPKLSLSFGASINNDQVIEGSDVSFECHIQANPKVSYIGWKVNSKTLIEDKNSGIIIKNQSLFLRKVTKEQSGLYHCEAANVEGKEKSDQVFFNVLFAPKCKKNQKTLIGVATRELIQIPCKVEADPSQVIFKWVLNNSFEVVPIKNFITNELTSIATYTPRTKYGYGEMYCWAINKVGEQEQPCVFKIIPAGPPKPIQNCLVGNQSMESLIIKCEAGEDGGLEQSFYLEVYHSISGIIQTNLSSNNSPVFEVHYLSKGTPFLLILYAANAKGRSNTVALTASTLPFPNKDVVFITPVLAVLIAIVGSLVFTALIIVMVSKIKKQKTNQDELGPFDEKDKPKDFEEKTQVELNEEKFIIQENKMKDSKIIKDESKSTNQIWISNKVPEESMLFLSEDGSIRSSKVPLINGILYQCYKQSVT